MAIAKDKNGHEIWKSKARGNTVPNSAIIRMNANSSESTILERNNANIENVNNQRITSISKPENDESIAKKRNSTDSLSEIICPTSVNPIEPENEIKSLDEIPGHSINSLGLNLGNYYHNQKIGFSVKYPTGWKVNDISSAINSQKPGSVWITFRENATSPIIINIHTLKLQSKTNTEIFVKYNPYLKNWKRKLLLGSDAFFTCTGTSESKRVIHRAILIRDGYAWMMNCIDTSGKPATESAAIFEAVINTLQTPTK